MKDGEWEKRWKLLKVRIANLKKEQRGDWDSNGVARGALEAVESFMENIESNQSPLSLLKAGRKE